jgi:hypothetical protein
MKDIRLLFSTGSGSSTHHLLGDHDTSLNGELPTAHFKQVFQAGTQEVDDKDVVQTLLTEVVDLRDTSCGDESQSVVIFMLFRILDEKTYDIHSGSCSFGIRLATEEHPTFGAPIKA